MKDFVEYIVKKLVDHPDEVRVSQIDSEKTVIMELQVKEGDLGKVIGKKGRTAKAIRTLLTAAAAKQGQKRAILEIIE
ncbi:MAG TPA: KH domain-containing protein [Candidatus Marinimicrobia bacterium]|nr:KH domain-containing protein [Candidatus Neomarinimicrobiota bacterium]